MSNPGHRKLTSVHGIKVINGRSIFTSYVEWEVTPKNPCPKLRHVESVAANFSSRVFNKVNQPFKNSESKIENDIVTNNLPPESPCCYKLGSD
jgi:hypothetical protein